MEQASCLFSNSTIGESWMELSPKAVRFIIEALEYRIKAYEENLNNIDTDSDENFYVANDIIYLEAIREELSEAMVQKLKNV